MKEALEASLMIVSIGAFIFFGALSLLALVAASKLDLLRSITINIQQQPGPVAKNIPDPNKPVTPYDIDPEFDPADWWKHDTEENGRN